MRLPGSTLLISLAAAVTVGGVVLALSGEETAADVAWAAVTGVILARVSVEVARSLLRRDAGVDAIALLAMAGALALGEYLAGAVIAVMLSGGNALEEYASGRAQRELRALLERAPRVAHRYTEAGLEEIDTELIEIGDRLMIRAGEVVPADCTVIAGSTSVDESAITGESLPVSVGTGEMMRSGTLNLGRSIDVTAIHSAADSTYAGIVRLVRSAQEERAPLVRLADRYAAVFLPVTLIVCAAAWALSGDVVRALAVLVVATPCPLILATPIAIISGVSRAARRGIVVKGGGAIEALGDARTVLLDKTGTLTVGEPRIAELAAVAGTEPEELLFNAASLDQASSHVLAESLVSAARARGIEPVPPRETLETPGEGIEGTVEGRRVALGRLAWLKRRLGNGRGDERDAGPVQPTPGMATVAVALDGKLAGVIELADPLRKDSGGMIEGLRAAGVERILLVTGDDREVAERIAGSVELDAIVAECSPEEKLEVVREERARGSGTVVMVGDGVNDAPALALADVGIAMGARGATAASESADAVLTVDQVDRVADAIRIGRRSVHVARQGVITGMGLSGIAMGFAAFGFLTPVAGALLQELIDVGVILNALRVLRD